jgi:protein-S-isoprenylcysteine O-methyltransferase Ste14
MLSLELRVPPLLIALVITIGMWVVASIASAQQSLPVFRMYIAVPMALAGVTIIVAGILVFRRARTTMNPLESQAPSSLVRSGIYKHTRNPMYAGMLLVLLAWATFLFTFWCLFGPLVFILYIDRFQIIPEERMLSKLFGSDYAEYKTKVRRWL